jgi:DNA-binding MarR family transcriptional regulator
MTDQSILMIVPQRSADPSPTPGAVAGELRAALSVLYRRMRQTRAAGELTLPESAALGRLHGAGPATSAALAKLEQISPQSMGVTLASLEAKGLLERSHDPADGRRVILSLTAAGRQTVHNKRAARTEQLTRALAGLTADERAQLSAVVPLLERLAEEL